MGSPESFESHAAPDRRTEQGRLALIQTLNARLPLKRNIGQGLLRNPTGDILLCQLAYKREWDLPGGVVDPRESPATCVEREIMEELGIEVHCGELLAVDWLPPYRGWDDAVLFLFDLGSVGSDIVDSMTLLEREIRAVHWVAPDDVADHVAPYSAALVAEVVRKGGGTAYLENSAPRGRN